MADWELRPFADRRDAGRRLADTLTRAHAVTADLVLGLPRGGVPVAAEVARVLGCPLDVFVVRKLGVPSHTELAFGAVASGGVRVLNDAVVSAHRLTPSDIERVAEVESAELRRREHDYRGDRQRTALDGARVVLVDDGLATGATMRAAALAVRQAGAAHVTCAVPVAPPAARSELADVADDMVSVLTPSDFYAVGQYYIDFTQTTDAEVRAALQ